MGLSNGSRVTGLNVNEAKVGDNVQCCIRPERLDLAGVLNQANTFEATVADVIYFGDHLRLRCTIAGQPEATVKLPLSAAMQPGHARRLMSCRGSSARLHLKPPPPLSPTFNQETDHETLAVPLASPLAG